jgi:hypothetical protein
LAGIFVRRCERLVDEERLVRRDHLTRLIEVDAAIHALDEHGIDLRQQGRNVGHDFDVVLVGDLFREIIDAAGAAFNVLAAAFVGGDHLHALFVEGLRESRDMRGVGADNSDAQRGDE